VLATTERSYQPELFLRCHRWRSLSPGRSDRVTTRSWPYPLATVTRLGTVPMLVIVRTIVSSSVS